MAYNDKIHYQILDQMNFYEIENRLDKLIEVTVDIHGSQGASFDKSYQLTQVATVRPHSTQEVAQVKLYGDWTLRIKFTYVVKNEITAKQEWVRADNLFKMEAPVAPLRDTPVFEIHSVPSYTPVIAHREALPIQPAPLSNPTHFGVGSSASYHPPGNLWASHPTAPAKPDLRTLI